jgi:hypothetical protein
MEEASVIRMASAAFASHRRPAPRVAAGAPYLPRDGVGALGVVALAVAVLLGIAVAVARGNLAPPPGCQPITYLVDSGAPRLLTSEMRAATTEIHRVTGLSFVRTRRANAQLSVAWRHGLRPVGPRTSASNRSHVLGTAAGRWASDGAHRVFAIGTVAIEADHAWTVGWDHGNTLTSVLVHELGHIAGLPHSEDPASFMYPFTGAQVRTWTANDIARLKEIGRRAGCNPAA